MCANLAAANCFTDDHLDNPDNWALVEKADFFYCAVGALLLAILNFFLFVLIEKAT